MNKKKISVNEAHEVLMAYFNSPQGKDLQDRVYELAQDTCYKQIDEIEHKYTVVDENGEPYDGGDGKMWYDESRQIFMETFFVKLKMWFDEQAYT